MTSNTIPHHASGHRRARFMKSGAAWFGLATVVFATCVAVESLSPLLPGATGLALAHRSAEVVAVPAETAAPVQPDTAPENLPVPAMQWSSDGPRECRLDAGIDTACVFN